MSAFDLAFFAASVDDAETNRKFAESLELNYPILSDPDKSAAGAFGVLHESGNFALRWTYFIDEAGTIVHIDKDVKPASAGEDLVRRLEELQFPKK